MRVRQQMVRQQDGLCGLQVGLARHDRGGMRGGLDRERVDHLEATVGDAAHRVAQPHPEQCGHLVVAGAARTQPATQVGTDAVDQAPLQRTVHVLVGGQRFEASVGDVGAQAVETREQAVALFVGEQTGAVQYPGVSLRRLDVVGRECPVEVRRLAQCR